MPSDISFSCPTCGAAFRVPAAEAGRPARCKRCDAQFQIPSPSPSEQPTTYPQRENEPADPLAVTDLPTEPGTDDVHGPAPDTLKASQRNTRTCPFCAEPIQAAAIKCRHCGEYLDGRHPAPRSLEGSLRDEIRRWLATKHGRQAALIVVPGVVLLGLALVWFVGSSPPPTQSSSPSPKSTTSQRPTVTQRRPPTRSFQRDSSSALDRAWTACAAAGNSRSDFRSLVDTMRETLRQSSPTGALQMAKGGCSFAAANNPGWSEEACVECYREIIKYLTE